MHTIADDESTRKKSAATQKQSGRDGEPAEVQDLDDLISRIEEAASKDERVSLEDVLDEVGYRSFAPFLLLSGIVSMAPVISDIPGVPVMAGLLVILVAGQMLAGRKQFWLPQWMLRRSMKSESLKKGLGYMKKPARFVDRIIRPRLTGVTRHAGTLAIALASVAVAALTPAMEFVPFSAILAGIALTAFGLALIANDGLLAIIAFVFTVVTIGALGMKLLG